MLSGAIFDRESMVCRTAFRYEAERHNNSTTSTFKLDRYEKDVNILGNFELSKAGIHNSYISKSKIATFSFQQILLKRIPYLRLLGVHMQCCIYFCDFCKILIIFTIPHRCYCWRKCVYKRLLFVQRLLKITTVHERKFDKSIRVKK